MAYSEASMRDMQQDALERLREMQARSKTAITPVIAESEVTETASPMANIQTQQNNMQQNGLSGLLGGLGGDKLLLLLILYLLYKNKADMKLLLAIGYLLL